ncbi:condensation domain-containing protein [Catellatospora sp. NPDC049133]|uniref:condensation domain-containing protein n=1 Tax=Catellatospora sp. NPDC049133 TaxID=3155499 RepID=UPI0033E9080A
MREVRHIAAPFTGQDRGSHDLTRGQANLLSVLLDGAAVTLSATLAAPAGTDLARLCVATAALMARHDSLRTTYRLGTRPTQVVNGGGHLDIAIYDSDTPLSEPELARVRDEVRGAPWTDLATRPPFRVAAVCAGPEVSHVILAICHVAADMAALMIILAELESLLAARELPPAGPQPVDLLALENTPALRRRQRNSLNYWRAQLRGTAHSLFPPGPATGRPFHRGLLVRSAPAAAAVEAASRRIGVGSRTVVLTAVSMVIAHQSGQRRCPVTSPTANRFLPGMQHYVGQLASDAFACLDLRTAETFDAAARLVARDTIRAYWHGWFDTGRLWSLFDEIAHERGVRAHAREFVFNDMSSLSAAPADEADQLSATRYGLIEKVGRHDDPSPARGRLGVGMAWLADEPAVSRLSFDLLAVEGELAAALWADPRCFSAADVVAMAEAVEKLLIAAGDGEVGFADLATVTGISAPVRGDGWRFVDSGWVELSTVRRLLAGVVGEDCLVTADDQAEGTRLVGFVADPTATLTPETVHLGCVAALPALSGTMTPHTYVICPAAPPDRDDARAWRAQRHLATGTGRGR